MKNGTKIISLCLMLLFMLSFSQSLWAEEGSGDSIIIKPFYWLPRIQGYLKITDPGNPETSFNMRRDLGLGSPAHLENFDDFIQRAFGFEIHLGSKEMNINLNFFQSAYKGVSILSQNMTFGSTTFPASSILDNKLRMQMFDLDVEFHIYQTSLFVLNALGGVKMMYFDISLNSSSPALTQKKKTDPIFPYIGVYAQVNIGKFFSIYGRIVGMTSSLAEEAFAVDSFYYIEGYLGVMVHLGSFLSAGVEWRNFGFKYKISSSTEETNFFFKAGGTTEEPYHAFLFFVMMRF